MTKVAAIGDIHGCLYELEELLNNPQLQDCEVWSLGDVVDKGPESNKCLELLQKKNVKLVVGNHDQKYVEFIRKNRNPDSIKSDEKREIYGSLSPIAKAYLLTASPYARFDGFCFVHGGVGPLHKLETNLDGKTFNEILRLRYVAKSNLEKVSTEHQPDGSWGPAIPAEQTWQWQEVYDGRYGTIIHGHNVEDYEDVKFWRKNGSVDYYSQGCFLDLSEFNAASLDTGCCYGGHLSAIVIDTLDLQTRLIQIKANKEYCAR